MTQFWWFIFLCITYSMSKQPRCPKKCNCNSLEYDELEVFCPTKDDYRMTFFGQPGEATRLKCSDDASTEDYLLLENLPSYPSPTLFLWLCPAPATTFQNLSRALMNPIDITRIYLALRKASYQLETKHFEGIQNLTELSLHYGINSMEADLLKKTPNLKKLDVANTDIIEIPENLFTNVPNLTSLQLINNKIEKLGKINHLVHLKILNLSNNKLSQLNGDEFKNLTRLKSLDIQLNLLKSLPSGVFDDLFNLMVLNLSGNEFETLPEKLLIQTNLTSFTLNKNRQILTIPDTFFANMNCLVHLTLMHNKIYDLPKNIFHRSKEIKNLNLRGNSLEELPLGIFEYQSELLTLDLGYNQITKLPDTIFRNLSNLNALNLEFNKLTYISSDLFIGLEKLQYLDMKHNTISFIDSRSFRNVINLREVQLSYNQLSLTNPMEFETNGFAELSAFYPCTKMELLNFSNNAISQIFFDWIHFENLDVLDLRFNNITNITNKDLNITSSKSIINLRNNYIKIIKTMPIEDVKTHKYIAPQIYISGNPLICDCLAYDLRYYINPNTSTSAYGFPQIEMEGFICSEPSHLAGRPFSDISPLELTCPLPTYSGCQCFYRPEIPTILYTSCAKKSDEGTKSVPEFSYTSLNLDNMMTWEPPEKLTNFLKQNKELRIREDIETCLCNVTAFLEWANGQHEMVNDTILCPDGTPISREEARAKCPTPGRLLFINSFVVAVVGITVGTLMALYYRYQQNIRVWMFAHQVCLWCVTEEELDRNKVFDAFVSFSHKDNDFVSKTLVPKLEEDGLKICVHYRDWVPGEFVARQIVRSVEASRRTIIVLSPNFLDSVWSHLEFQAAHKRAMSEGRARVVVIMYQPLPDNQKLDPELKAYINVNSYVQWGDPWFWKKLRYALPHSPLPLIQQVQISEDLELVAVNLISEHFDSSPQSTEVESS